MTERTNGTIKYKGIKIGSHYKDGMEKLAEYEDAEENGLLARLPCKKGDTVYWVGFYRGKYRIVEYVVDRFEILSSTTVIWCGSTLAFHDREIGKRVFFDTSEAERRLEELKNE